MSRFEGPSLRYDPEFTAYYDRWLAPLESGHRAGRSGGMRTSIIRGIQSLVLLAAVGGGMFLFAETWDGFGGWLAMVTTGIVVLVLGVWTIDPARTHTLLTKERITPILVGYFGDFTFEQEGKFGLGPFPDWELLDRHDESRFGDVVTGSYRGVPLRIAELKLAKRVRDRDRTGTSLYPVFSGLFAEYELPEPVTTVTFVVNDNPMWDKRAKKRGWSRLDFEAPGFSAYTVGGADVAHPLPLALAGVLTRLRSTFRAKHLLAAFGESRLVILLEGAKNAFEPTVTSEVSLFDEADLIREQLGSLARVVENLAIGPSAEVRDDPRPVDEAALEEKAAAHGDDFQGMGCLPLMVLTTALFLFYGWLLKDAENDTAAFAFSLIASPMLASAVLKLNELRTKEGVGGLSGQVVKIALATVPLYFLLKGF